jgi:hypothetical protein
MTFEVPSRYLSVFILMRARTSIPLLNMSRRCSIARMWMLRSRYGVILMPPGVLGAGSLKAFQFSKPLSIGQRGHATHGRVLAT